MAATHFWFLLIEIMSQHADQAREQASWLQSKSCREGTQSYWSMKENATPKPLGRRSALLNLFIKYLVMGSFFY